MSSHVEVRTFKQVETVVIDCCDKKEIEQLENAMILSLRQKLEKINILIRNCNVYSYGETILVNDRYNVCKDIGEIAEAFGLTIKQIQCNLKGRNYVISDKLFNVLKQLGTNYNLGIDISNQQLTDEIESIIKNNIDTNEIDQNILAMVQNIKKNGKYTTTKTRTITTEYNVEGSWSQLRSQSVGAWESNEQMITNQLLKLSRETQNIVNKTNEQLRDGTAKLLYSRARQMGYAVKEEKKNNQIQLVLVRCE